MHNLTIKLFLILFVGFLGFANDVTGEVNSKSHQQHKKAIWSALHSDDHLLLDSLLGEDKLFFDNDAKRVRFSKIGEGFITGQISLATLNVMYQHGFDLNDLRAIKVSSSVQDIIREFGVRNSNVDMDELPPALQQQLRKALDLTYYNDRNYDPYYLERFAKHRASHNTMEKVTWLLEHGYTPKPIALGYALAEFISREDYKVTPDDVETLHSFGMLISMREKENMVHRNYNAYKILYALVLSGKMDNATLVDALLKNGLEIRSKGPFNHSIMRIVCNALSEDFFEKHIQGIRNLRNHGLEMYLSELRMCSEHKLDLFSSLGNTEDYEVIRKAKYYHRLDNPQRTTSQELDNLVKNPIFLSMLFVYGIPIVLFIIIVMIVIAIRRKGKENA